MSGKAPRPARPASLRAALVLLALAGGVATALAQSAGAPRGPAEPAGEVRLEASADRTAITVGDPVTLTVRLTHARGARLLPFNPERFLGDLTLLERRNNPPQTLPDGRVQDSWTLRVAVYRTGTATVPAFEATYSLPSGGEGKATSAPLTLQIGSVLKPGETAPADIKKQAEMPEPLLWPFVLGGLLLAAAFAWYLLRRRRARPTETAAAPAAPARPPHEIAYAELERLLGSGWLEAGRIKEFYVELAEIIRRYVEGRFRVDTFERTTTEILEALRLARVPVKATSIASEFFGVCDLVKFAKYQPGVEESRATVTLAYRLVDESRPAATAPAPEAAQVATAGGASR